MASKFTLPKSAAPLAVAIKFNTQEREYLQRWFNEKRKDGSETPEQFIKRVLLSAAFMFRKVKIERQIRSERGLAASSIDAATRAEQDALSLEFTSATKQVVGDIL